MKIFLAFLLIFDNMGIFYPKMRLQRGRILFIEEGYNEEIANKKFLEQLDDIDKKLDNF